MLTLGGQLQAGEVTVRFASRIVGAHRRFPRKRRAHGQGEERHPPVDRQWARADTGIGPGSRRHHLLRRRLCRLGGDLLPGDSLI